MRIQDSAKSKLVQHRALTGSAGSDALNQAAALGTGALLGRSARKSAAGLPLLMRPIVRKQATLSIDKLNRFRF